MKELRDLWQEMVRAGKVNMSIVLETCDYHSRKNAKHKTDNNIKPNNK